MQQPALQWGTSVSMGHIFLGFLSGENSVGRHSPRDISSPVGCFLVVFAALLFKEVRVIADLLEHGEGSEGGPAPGVGLVRRSLLQWEKHSKDD
jgi:hypothetical protein